MSSTRRAVPVVDVVVSCIVVYEFAIAQPLLDLLGRNAEFFVARRSPPSDVIVTALIVAVLIPAVLALVVGGVSRLHAPTGAVVHWIVLTMLGGVLAVQVFNHTPIADLTGWIQVVLALALGALLTFAYYRLWALRWVVRFGAITPLLFVGLFVFASPVSKVVFGSPAEALGAVGVGKPAPVVMLVFDEFPVASLMDDSGDLERDLYPNFARLADDGTWYRNATGVQQQTTQALPAIVTGVDPPPDKLPMAADYPNSLFTLLADTYDITAYEPVTDLCPDYACPDSTQADVSTAQRWRTLSSDLAVISGHLFLPDDFTRGLPSIDHSWSNFAAEQDAIEAYDIVSEFNERVREDRRLYVEDFIDGLSNRESGPTLDFLHVLYPHFPWNTLPTGQTYSTPVPYPATVTTGWGSDEWLVDQVYQQHLLQVQFVDTILGQVLDQLDRAGVYDDTLVVVVADHGIAIKPNVVHRRVILPDTVGEVAAVPLFIKEPHQPKGGIDDYRAETIDVLPTIADVLGIDLPWATDGVSLSSPNRPVRTQSQMEGAEGIVTFGVDGSEVKAVAARKIEIFGDDGPYALAPPGQRDLLGAAVASLDVESAEAERGSIDNADAYADVDLHADRLPTTVIGVVDDGSGDADRVVAVVVNGEVAAVTRTYHADGEQAFYALVPPSAFVDGRNEVELLLVEGTGPNRTLRRLDD
jgi:Sulfatase